MVDLEQELSCQSKLLAENLNSIKIAAEQIWNNTALYWFTDHGIEHSRRIINHIEEIVAPLLSGDQRFFSPEELFVLLAACYLHDVGMQYVRTSDGRSSNQLTPNDYELIRDLHPETSSIIIRDSSILNQNGKLVSPFNIPRTVLEQTSLVVLAHGSKYWETALGHMDQLPSYANGRLFRCKLLAALLLMGDELDLDSRRSKDQLSPAQANARSYPQESLLHLYKHSYITDARVSIDVYRTITISVEFHFPRGSEKLAREMKTWVLSKLRRQCRATEEIFGSDGINLRWNDKILYRETFGKPNIIAPLPQDAMPLLREMAAYHMLVDRDDLIGKLEDYINGHGADENVFIIWGSTESDLAYVRQWLINACKNRASSIICREIKLTVDSSWSPADILESSRELMQSDMNGVLIFFVEVLEESLAEWLRDDFLPRLLNTSDDRSNTAIFFCNGQLDAIIEKYSSKNKFELGQYTKNDISSHLQSKWGCTIGQADPLSTTLCKQSSGIIINLIDNLMLDNFFWEQKDC